MPGLETADGQRGIADHARDLNTARAEIHHGRELRSEGHSKWTHGCEDHMLALIGSALRGARGFRVGEIACRYFRALALGEQGRPADGHHSKEVHDSFPSLMAPSMP